MAKARRILCVTWLDNDAYFTEGKKAASKPKQLLNREPKMAPLEAGSGAGMDF
jgi:hypothetical protein